MLISLLQSLFVCVESSSNILLFLSFKCHGLLHLLNLFQTVHHLLTLLVFTFLPSPINLSLLEFQLLVVLQGSCQFTEILPECVILKCELINGCPVLVYMVDNCSVFNVDVQLRLQTMVFFIYKVHLCLKFFNDFSVLALVILHSELIIVLAALIQATQTQDLRVTDFDGSLQLRNTLL